MTDDKAAQKALAAVPGYRKATVYVSERHVVSVCHRLKPRSRDSRGEFVLKIGRPNFREALFIKQCKIAGVPFPVRKVQLQPWPVKRPRKA